MMRPRPARWFEVLCARQDSGRLLQALGNTGAVELEARSGAGLPAEFAAMAGGLAEFHAWQPAARALLRPAPRLGNPCPLPPAETLDQALDAVCRWGHGAREISPPCRPSSTNAWICCGGARPSAPLAGTGPSRTLPQSPRPAAP